MVFISCKQRHPVGDHVIVKHDIKQAATSSEGGRREGGERGREREGVGCPLSGKITNQTWKSAHIAVPWDDVGVTRV